MKRSLSRAWAVAGIFLGVAALLAVGCQPRGGDANGQGATPPASTDDGVQDQATMVAEQAGMADDVELPSYGVVQLRSISGSDVQGSIEIREEGEGVRFTGTVTGLEPGMHGFHIHEFGDLSDSEGQSAGGHFNPTGRQHGGPDAEEHHAGDLGNIEANDAGEGTVDVTAPWLKLHYILGRSLVVHGGEDDLTSQPSGDAGARVAVGIIGIGNPETSRQ